MSAIQRFSVAARTQAGLSMKLLCGVDGAKEALNMGLLGYLSRGLQWPGEVEHEVR